MEEGKEMCNTDMATSWQIKLKPHHRKSDLHTIVSTIEQLNTCNPQHCSYI